MKNERRSERRSYERRSPNPCPLRLYVNLQFNLSTACLVLGTQQGYIVQAGEFEAGKFCVKFCFSPALRLEQPSLSSILKKKSKQDLNQGPPDMRADALPLLQVGRYEGWVQKFVYK